MARKSKSEREAQILADARAEFDAIQAACKDERRQCVEDRRFYSIAGAQWEGPLGEQFENKPKLENNKIHMGVMRIINEYRNNRITVDFVTKDGSQDDLADVCDGLYRADEQDSCAEEAYDNAFEEAAGGGMGAWRLRTCYENEYDEGNEKQRIRIEPIYDADTSVFFDLNAKRQDKSDAKSCYVVYSMSRDAYKAKYGDDPATWPKDVNTANFDWNSPDVTYIAEYYRVEDVSENVRTFVDPEGETVKHTDDELEDMGEKLIGEEEGDRSAIEAALDDLTAKGVIEVKARKVKRRKVRKYIMSGARILEDCGYIAGKNIPIVPVYGKRWFVDNIERCMGAVRLAKDPQRIYNMMVSKLAEIAALSPIRKPIFLSEQIAGLQDEWSKGNINDYPFYRINSIEGADGSTQTAGPVGYLEPPDVPAALGALIAQTGQDMNELLGMNQGAEQVVSNISGKAVEMIQSRLDMQSYIFMSNFAKAMRRCGEIWLSMAKDTYVEDERPMKSVGEQGDVSRVELAKPVIGDNGEIVLRNDLTKADFDVVPDVGPSFTSRRDATVRMLTGLLQMANDPQDAKVITSLILMNAEGEGLADVNRFYRKQLVQMGVIEPNEEELAAMAEAANQEQQPDPNAEYLQAAAGKEQALADKAVADTEKSIADAGKTRAETVEIMAGLGSALGMSEGA
jgi:hypothetical protein